MKKIKISSVVQGLILMTLGLICNTTLLVLMLFFFKIETTAFIIVFSIVEMFILFVLNQLIGEYKDEQKKHN